LEAIQKRAGVFRRINSAYLVTGPPLFPDLIDSAQVEEGRLNIYHGLQRWLLLLGIAFLACWLAIFLGVHYKLF
jgi:hypothetical protein